MIQTDVGLRQTIDVIANMYHTLAELHRRIAPQNLDNYHLMAEGPIEEIRRAQAELNEFLQIADAFTPGAESERQAG